MTCAFTGHRPQDLPWGFAESGPDYENFKARLLAAVLDLIQEGCTHFISGMAQGVDTLCAEIVLGLKATHPGITLECALPFAGQAAHWPKRARARYDAILAAADKVTVVCKGGYMPYVMGARNRYMVDSADVVIAGFHGGSGGTKNTVDYAVSRGKRLIIVAPKII